MGALYLLTIKEMLRKKFLLLASLLAILFLLFYGLGLFFIHRDMQRHVSQFYPIFAAQMMSMAIYMSSFLSALLVVFSTAGTLAAELENGILHSIVPKPIHRSSIIGSKFAGVATISIIFDLLLLSCILGVSWLITRQPVQHFPLALSYYFLQSLVLLAATLYCSVLLPTIAAGVTGIMIFMVGVIGGMIEQFGVLLNNQSLVNTGIVSSLIIPTDPLYRLIYATVTPKMGNILSNAGPFGAASLPSVWMVVYAVLYVLVFFRVDYPGF